MNEAKFPDCHWSYDWDLLRGIVSEWATIRDLFGWSPMVQNRTITKRLDEIIGAADYPHITQLFDKLRCDETFCSLVTNLIISKPSLRAPHTELLAQLLLRCNMIVWRNGQTWLVEHFGKSEHWGMFCNIENLGTELERADQVICPTPKGEVRRPNVRLVFEPASHHAQFDWVDAVDELVSKGLATPLEGELFLQWYEQPDPPETHLTPSSVSTLSVPQVEMKRIVRKFSRIFEKTK